MSCNRVVLDGLNLRLHHGTGIATYGANLARLLRQLGFGVDVLYDRRVSGGADRLKQELSFYAAQPKQGGGRSSFPVRLARRVAEAVPWAVATCRGARLAEVRPDIVLPGDGLPHHPAGAGVLSMHDLFRRASASARLLRRPMRLRLPAGSALHLTYTIPMVAMHAPTIMTVHDVIPLRMPHAVIDPGFRFLQHLRVIAQNVDHIVTVSESVKQDLLRVIRVPPEKITVTYQPVRPIEGFDPDLAAGVVEKVYGLTPGKYFVFTGAIEPKKNLPRLIEAYLLSGSEKPLIIVGPDGWAVEEQLAPRRQYQARQKELRGTLPRDQCPPEKIRRLGYVHRAHLAALVSQACALLFPSLYEGFGLPVVEAMQLGVPVLAGSHGSLPEIAGDAALLVDPYDVAAIAHGIRQLDADSDLRATLRAAGLRNVTRFSDEACLERLVSAYRAAGIGIPAAFQEAK